MRASQLCQRMELALKSQRWQEAIHLGHRVLRVIPHYLWAEALLGQAYLAQDQDDEAAACFRAVMERDPECTAARVGLGLPRGAVAGSDAIGGGITPTSYQHVSTREQPCDEPSQQAVFASDHCQQAEVLWRLGSLQEAAGQARRALQMAPRSAKATLLLADIAWQRGDQDEFAEWFHQARHLDPSGVVASRVWGTGHPLLDMVRVDPLVPEEMSQDERRDRAMPHGGSRQSGSPPLSSQRGVPQPQDVPWLLESSVAQSVGTPDWSASRQVDRPMDTRQDQELAEIERELNRIASSLGIDGVSSALSCPQPLPPFGRKVAEHSQGPVRLIVTNREPLEAKYGPVGASRVHQALTQLANAISAEEKGQALVLYLDDGQALQPYGLAPADPRDAEELKFTLDRLQDCLQTTGRGELDPAPVYILLVGGDDIVPFHRLSDSNGDEDGPVLSDHPYACSGDAGVDGRYLSPDRVVGRLPDGVSQDVGFLLRLITVATEAHRSTNERKSLWQALGGWLSRSSAQASAMSFGYTASIWRRAAREVFRSIGQPSHLRTSPPLTCDRMPPLGPIAPRFSYFNLHGLRDSAYWYGQRDPTYAAGYPLFPVAIQPDNIPVVSCPRSVVFSEACYGAHILGKDQMSSLALRFLAAQALGVVASTSLAYGALDTPLMGADLLAQSFWERVRAGRSLGEALQEAKEALIQEMLARQGYLDPEDEKTVLGFVLLGDPTLIVDGVAEDGREELSSQESAHTAASQRTSGGSSAHLAAGNMAGGVARSTVCRRRAVQPGLVAPELLVRVQDRLASYVPSSMWGHVTVSAQTVCGETRCDGQCDRCQVPEPIISPKVQVSTGEDDEHASARAALVLTLHQKSSIPKGDQGEMDIHQQIAKVTVDSHGNLVKIAMSR